MRYTYSWRDSERAGAICDPDELMESLASDILSDGDIASVLKRVIHEGIRRGGAPEIEGVNSLLARVESQRREELERYDLGSAYKDIEDWIRDVVQTERSGLERRRAEAEGAGASLGDELRGALETVTDRSVAVLDGLSSGAGSAVTALTEYEFVNELARSKFDALLDMLQRHVLQTHFKAMQHSLLSLDTKEIGALSDALHALNDLIEQRESLHCSEFERFRERHGSHFPSSGSLEELIARLQEQAARTESLLCNMAPDVRRALEESMAPAMDHPRLPGEMSRFNGLIEAWAGERPTASRYPFSGQQSLTLEEALRLMRRMHELDLLERALQAVNGGTNLDAIDPIAVEELLGAEARNSFDVLGSLQTMLEEAGYLECDGQGIRLTARGMRRIGQKALNDIFEGLDRAGFGEHAVASLGPGSSPSEQSKQFEFGDPFLLDLGSTLMNAVRRSGPGRCLKPSVEDFDVFATEGSSEAATVLMVDLSRSMPLRGCFAAAKKVALALNTLIGSRFPRDHLYVVGFSDYARELRAESLYRFVLCEQARGTNIQHGLIVARRLLTRHRCGTRQIILITDGEPTAHLEGSRLRFTYPPHPSTVGATLREVQRCTRERIVINTFMLEGNHHLAEFVQQMARINRGRVFFATPERLGDYVLVDYVRGRRAVP